MIIQKACDFTQNVCKFCPQIPGPQVTNFSNFTGDSIGTVVATSGSGFLCEHGFDNGWGSVFYVYGRSFNI